MKKILETTISASSKELLRSLEQASGSVAKNTGKWGKDLHGVDKAAKAVTAAVEGIRESAANARPAQLKVIDFARLNSQIRSTSERVGELMASLLNATSSKGIDDSTRGAITNLARLSNALSAAGRELKGLERQTTAYGAVERAASKTYKFWTKVTIVVASAKYMFRQLSSAIATSLSALSEIGQGARDLGITAEAFQRLRKSADDNNIPFDRVKSSISAVGDALLRARHGSEEYAGAFDLLGLKLSDLLSLSPEEAFMQVARASAVAADGSQAQAAAIRILGERYEEAAKFADAYAAASKSVAAVFDSKTIESAERLKKLIDGIKDSLVELSVRLKLIDAAELLFSGDAWRNLFKRNKGATSTGPATKEELAAARRRRDELVAAAAKERQATESTLQMQVAAAKEAEAKKTEEADSRAMLAKSEIRTLGEIEAAERRLADAKRRLMEAEASRERELNRRRADEAIAQQERMVQATERRMAGFGFALPKGFDIDESVKTTRERGKLRRLDESISGKIDARQRGERVSFTSAERKRIMNLQALQDRASRGRANISGIEAGQRRSDASEAARSESQRRKDAQQAVARAAEKLGEATEGVSRHGKTLQAAAPAKALEALKPSGMLKSSFAAPPDYTGLLARICGSLDNMQNKCYVVR